MTVDSATSDDGTSARRFGAGRTWVETSRSAAAAASAAKSTSNAISSWASVTGARTAGSGGGVDDEESHS
jgi:hypothetical protein